MRSPASDSARWRRGGSRYIHESLRVGTEIDIRQENLPDVIPVEACYLGWQESLRNLARLVEPDITG